MKQAPQQRPDGRGLRIAVLRSAFNVRVVDGLVDGARRDLAEMGAAAGDVTLVDVPGAFELPLAAMAAALSGRFDAVVALGAVIRGGTDHYEHICRAAASGLAAVARETGVPVGFGVLTCAREDQALARSAPGPDNKGAEAARAAVAMVHVVRSLGGRQQATERNGKTTTEAQRARRRTETRKDPNADRRHGSKDERRKGKATRSARNPA